MTIRELEKEYWIQITEEENKSLSLESSLTRHWLPNIAKVLRKIKKKLNYV